MKYRSLLKLTVCLIFTLLITSCQDERVAPDGKRYRLKTYRTLAFRSDNIYTFNYDATGKISDYVISTDYSIQNATPHYDAQNRLVDIDILKGLGTYARRKTYEYNSNGNIAIARFYSDPYDTGDFKLDQTYTFEYTSTKMPSKVTTINSDNSTQAVEYIYDHENIVKVDFFDNGVSTFSSQYTYDDKPNPLYGLIELGPSSETFSKNNTVSTANETIYDSNGLKTSLSVNYKSTSIYDRYKYIYTYEAY